MGRTAKVNAVSWVDYEMQGLKIGESWGLSGWGAAHRPPGGRGGGMDPTGRCWIPATRAAAYAALRREVVPACTPPRHHHRASPPHSAPSPLGPACTATPLPRLRRKQKGRKVGVKRKADIKRPQLPLKPVGIPFPSEIPDCPSRGGWMAGDKPGEGPDHGLIMARGALLHYSSLPPTLSKEKRWSGQASNNYAELNQTSDGDSAALSSSRDRPGLSSTVGLVGERQGGAWVLSLSARRALFWLVKRENRRGEGLFTAYRSLLLQRRNVRIDGELYGAALGRRRRWDGPGDDERRRHDGAPPSRDRRMHH